MICEIGWALLSSDGKEDAADNLTAKKDLEQLPLVESKLFYPITFPITTRAGTIAVFFTLSAHGADNDLSQYLFRASLNFVQSIFYASFITYKYRKIYASFIAIKYKTKFRGIKEAL